VYVESLPRKKGKGRGREVGGGTLVSEKKFNWQKRILRPSSFYLKVAAREKAKSFVRVHGGLLTPRRD